MYLYGYIRNECFYGSETSRVTEPESRKTEDFRERCSIPFQEERLNLARVENNDEMSRFAIGC